MIIRPSTIDDLAVLQDIYACAREYMRNSGNPTQWGNNRPLKEAIIADIMRGNNYIVENEGIACGTFSFIIGEDITYAHIENGQWLNEEQYGTIHKLASNGKVHGIFHECIRFCEMKMNNLRADTHADNTTMQHLLEKNGFIKCGIIYVDDGTPRIAYQKYNASL